MRVSFAFQDTGKRNGTPVGLLLQTLIVAQTLMRSRARLAQGHKRVLQRSPCLNNGFFHRALPSQEQCDQHHKEWQTGYYQRWRDHTSTLLPCVTLLLNRYTPPRLASKYLPLACLHLSSIASR